MSRTRIGITFLALVVVAATVCMVAVPTADAVTLDQRLRAARRALCRAQTRCATLQERIDVATAAGQERGIGILVLDLERAKRVMRARKAAVRVLLRRIAQREAAAAAARSGDWRLLIGRAAARYDVSARGLYRLMIMESGGRARVVGAGRYYGLFQFALSTWRGDWNPWKGRSVFDGAAQINATAYAIKRGMGRSLWVNTYPLAF